MFPLIIRAGKYKIVKIEVQRAIDKLTIDKLILEIDASEFGQ